MSEYLPAERLHRAQKVAEVLEHAGLADEADALGISDTIVSGEYQTGYEAYLQHSRALLEIGHAALDADVPADMRQTWQRLDGRLVDLHIERMNEACDIADAFVRQFPALLYRRNRYGSAEGRVAMQTISGFTIEGLDRPRQASIRALMTDEVPSVAGQAYCDVATLPATIQSKINSYLLEL